jgi:sec-independent protein translocase protein TatA
MPSWIGPWEIVIVVVVALLIFGPKKLPEFGSSLGKSLSGFKRGLREGKEELQAAMKEDGTAADAKTDATEKTDEG